MDPRFLWLVNVIGVVVVVVGGWYVYRDYQLEKESIRLWAFK